MRETREEVRRDLEHLSLSESTRKLVDLTLFVSNTGSSDNDFPNSNWESPSLPLADAVSEIRELIAEDGETIRAELNISRIWLESLLKANHNLPEAQMEMGALDSYVETHLERDTLSAINLALSHFGTPPESVEK